MSDLKGIVHDPMTDFFEGLKYIQLGLGNIDVVIR